MVLQLWEVLIVPLLVLSISQCVKVVLDSRTKGFSWRHFDSYGGMPSTHTAMFVSLTLVVGLREGFASSVFALAFFVSAAFIRDAVGIRWSLGFHGKILNHLIATLSPDDRRKFPKHLEERLGHTPMEALLGGLLGVVLTLVLHALIQSGL